MYKLFGVNYMPIITSRGMPLCMHLLSCQKNVRSPLQRKKPSKVVDELEWLRDEYHAGAFAFYDDTFTFDLKRAHAICDEMQERKVDLPWDCRTRVDRVNKEFTCKVEGKPNCQLYPLWRFSQAALRMAQS